MKRVIALLMENQPGALSRVVGLFSQRGYNIETLIVAPTTDPTLSRLTMSTNGDEKIVQQITKQLDKLIDVVTVADLGESDFVETELMLVKLNRSSVTSDEINKLEGKVYSLDKIKKILNKIDEIALMKEFEFINAKYKESLVENNIKVFL